MADIDLTPAQYRRVDGICKEIDQYLTLRFQHAERVSPNIGQCADDIKAQLLVTLREVLMKGRSWATEKLMTADILCGDDLNRRYAILNITGQYSILHEIVTSLSEGDSTSGKSDVIRIATLKGLYTCIDPSVGNLIELTQTWIWWDMPDAVNRHAFEAQLARIRKILGMEITEKVSEFYCHELGLAPGTEITQEQILGHELRRLRRFQTEFELHRHDEMPHQEILKRVVVDDAGVNHLIVKLAEEIRRLEELSTTEELSEEMTGEYARRLASDPKHVQRGHVLQFQRERIEELKEQVHTAIVSGQVLGPPFNFKQQQLQEMKAELEEILQLLPEEAIEAEKAEAERDKPEERGPVV